MQHAVETDVSFYALVDARTQGVAVGLYSRALSLVTELI